MIEYIILFALGLYIGHKITSYFHIIALRTLLDDLGVTENQLRKVAKNIGIEFEEEDQEESLDEHEIVVEKHGEQLYAFMTNGEFIGQGSDRESLVNRIAERFKNVKFTVKEGSEYLKDPAT